MLAKSIVKLEYRTELTARMWFQKDYCLNETSNQKWAYLLDELAGRELVQVEGDQVEKEPVAELLERARFAVVQYGFNGTSLHHSTSLGEKSRTKYYTS